MFLLPSISALIWAWIISDRVNPKFCSYWRYRIGDYGLGAASIATLAEGTFLLHGAYKLGSFYHGPRGAWLALSLLGVLLWTFAIVVSVLGKGSFRLPLLIWGLTLFGAAYMIVSLGTSY